ncbi:MAG: apolipoprotein N-acyltransferase [Pseudomonadota bacterium]
MSNATATASRITLPSLFWAALSGALLTGAFPDIGLAPLAAVGLAPLLMALRNQGLKNGFLLGWTAGMVHHLTLLYWTAYTMHVYGLLPWALSIPVLVLLAAYLSLYTGVFAALAARLHDRPAWFLAGTPCVWVALEYIRAHALTGFPWAQLGTSLGDWPVIIQMADVTGVYGLSFLLVLVNAAATLLWRTISEKPAQPPALVRKQAAAAVSAALIAVFAAVLYGTWRLAEVEARMKTAPSVRVAVIQGNIDQAVKWDRQFLNATIATYLDLSRTAATRRPDLIVWPETATPYYYGHQPEMDAVIDAGIRQVNAYFLIGTPTYTRDAGGLAYFNTAQLTDPAARPAGSYSKVHLVPFGEYVPLKRWLPFIGKMVAQVGDFTTGRPGETLPWPKGRIGAQICYEIIFPGPSRQMVRNGADLLVNITNDAWFGRTGAPYQHFAMAAFRAVENRRALVRAANTGVSGFVSPTGRPLSTTPLFEATIATADLPRLTMTTIYTRFGDAFAVLCLVAATILAWRSTRWQRH